jgi:hypothetical protein
VSWTDHRLEHARQPRPYQLDALAHALGIPPDATGTIAQHLDIDRRWVRRIQRMGLTARQADHWAARAGLHADIVWPGWWDDPTDTDPLPDEDDPALDEVDPITPERLEALRAWRQAAA